MKKDLGARFIWIRAPQDETNIKKPGGLSKCAGRKTESNHIQGLNDSNIHVAKQSLLNATWKHLPGKIIYICYLELFSSECSKNTSKVITTANHKGHREYTMNQSKLEEITCHWREARQYLCERVTIGFGFTSYWMKNWHEFFLSQSWSVVDIRPITFHLNETALVVKW